VFTKLLFPATGHYLLENSTVPRIGHIRHGSTSPKNEQPWLALGLVLCAHLAVFAALHPQTRSLPDQTEPEPIMISLISAPQPTPPKQAQPVQPQAKPQKPVKKQVKTPPAAKPVVTQTSQPIAQPVQQTAEPVAPAVAKQETKPAETPSYQSPSFNAAYLNNPAPSYPPVSRRLGEQGLVLLQVQVNADGTAGSVELQTGSGSGRLDQAALEAVKQWRFTPAKRGDRPVSASVVVPVRFSLEG
jgi:protein TonB